VEWNEFSSEWVSQSEVCWGSVIVSCYCGKQISEAGGILGTQGKGNLYYRWSLYQATAVKTWLWTCVRACVRACACVLYLSCNMKVTFKEHQVIIICLDKVSDNSNVYMSVSNNLKFNSEASIKWQSLHAHIYHFKCNKKTFWFYIS
jgi:hypothetical protein